MKELKAISEKDNQPERNKKIAKKRKIVRTLQIKSNYESFYTGGEILLTGESLIASLYDNKIRLYNTSDNKVVLTIEHENEEICNFEYLKNKSGEYILSFTSNGILRFLKLTKEEGVYSTTPLKSKKIVKFAAVEMKVDKSKNFLVIADSKGNFKILNLKDFIIIREFNLGMGYIKMKLINQYIIFLSKERKAIFYNIMTNNITRRVESIDKTAFSEFVVLHGAKKSLLLAGFDNKLYLNRTENQLEEICSLGGFVQTMESLKLPNEEKTLIVVGYDNGQCELLIYNNENDQCQSTGVFLENNKHAIGKILFDYKNQFFFVITDESEIFKMKLKKTNRNYNLSTVEEIIGLNDEIMEVKFIDRNNLIICSNTETIRQIDVNTNKTHFIHGHQDLVTACDIYNAEKMITGSKDGRLILWNINKEDSKVFPEVQKRYKGHIGGVTSLHFGSKTGKIFVSSGTDGFVKLWNLEKNTCRSLKTQFKELNFAKISPNEKFFIFGSHHKTINLNSVKDLSVVCKIEAHKRGVWDAEFAPLENKFASCSSDTVIKIWDFSDPSSIVLSKTLEGHQSAVLKVKWILYGLQMVSASAEGIVKVWNVKKETCLASFTNNTGRIWALDVLEEPDCFNVLSGDNDNNLILWEDATDDLVTTEVGKRQDLLALREKMTLLWSKGDFIEAVKVSFEKGLNSSFFESLYRFYISFNEGSKFIYLAEDNKKRSSFNVNERFKQEISPTIGELWKNEKTKLLKLLRSFITNKRFLLVVELLLQVVLKIVKVKKIGELKDELKENDIDIDNLLNIYKIFNQRHLNTTIRDLKAVHCMDFKIRQNLDMLN